MANRHNWSLVMYSHVLTCVGVYINHMHALTLSCTYPLLVNVGDEFGDLSSVHVLQPVGGFQCLQKVQVAKSLGIREASIQLCQLSLARLQTQESEALSELHGRHIANVVPALRETFVDKLLF